MKMASSKTEEAVSNGRREEGSLDELSPYESSGFELQIQDARRRTLSRIVKQIKEKRLSIIQMKDLLFRRFEPIVLAVAVKSVRLRLKCTKLLSKSRHLNKSTTKPGEKDITAVFAMEDGSVEVTLPVLVLSEDESSEYDSGGSSYSEDRSIIRSGWFATIRPQDKSAPHKFSEYTSRNDVPGAKSAWMNPWCFADEDKKPTPTSLSESHGGTYSSGSSSALLSNGTSLIEERYDYRSFDPCVSPCKFLSPRARIHQSRADRILSGPEIVVSSSEASETSSLSSNSSCT